MFKWWRERKRREILAQPFPPAWRNVIKARVGHARYLSFEERRRLEQLVQVFVAEKCFVGCSGLEIDDAIRVTIAANACLLLLGLDHDLYRRAETIYVYPSTVVSPKDGTPITGQAQLRGPVLLVWDATVSGSRHATSGHNVVIHEFAHKLDMLDDCIDGTPPLRTSVEYATWTRVCNEAFTQLSRRVNAGRRCFLSDYAATNEAEFFAVATEVFFEKPKQLARQHKELYQVLSEFYRQNPAGRMPGSKGKGNRNARRGARKAKRRRAAKRS